MPIFQWVIDNQGSLAALFSAFHIIAVVVVNLTPTPKDDIWLGKFYKVVEAAAGIITVKSKQPPGGRT